MGDKNRGVHLAFCLIPNDNKLYLKTIRYIWETWEVDQLTTTTKPPRKTYATLARDDC